MRRRSIRQSSDAVGMSSATAKLLADLLDALAGGSPQPESSIPVVGASRQAQRIRNSSCAGRRKRAIQDS